ncbi:E3 ubiquitin-protein ligase RNF213-like [Saccostrea echinata]|uniref:E3 ubiquitin-protein ligase RNF213-like n=1 Tax=Saccostrea echinata TaxID=191078 RepID=UPI002A80B0D1|nr:E3 ubiquitin-protein ligase RNF213-like [Saccostrea echinata]
MARRSEIGHSLTVEDVFDSVWKSVHQSWRKLKDQLRSGEITFKEFETYFDKLDMAAIKKELSLFSDSSSDSWILERYNQIEQYKILRQCLKGAIIILEFVEEFKLKGDFSPIERIVEMEKNDDIQMKKLDIGMMKTCDILRGIKKAEIECIETLIQCKQVVLWLRTYMKNLQELNVFADLATMTAGEGDMEVDKVNFLHSATRGYAALIFDLGESCGYTKFIERCKQVWKELAADPNLPEKMKDTKRNLDWFDGVKQFQGSVEVSSMEQAKTINAAGIYVVGNLQEDSPNHKLNVDDVLQLHIKDETQGQGLRPKYQYKDLQELQSKLMLVAGKAEKGKEDVDRFTMILDSVVRLSNVYIKLVESGCVLFTNWQARFLCDPGRAVCAFITFGTGKECKQLKGRRNEEDDVITIMPEIAKFMENCLEEWLCYLDEKRDEYYHLNHFTIDQVVILQRELARFNAGEEISNLTIPLLSIVNNDCSYHDLTDAMQKANEEVEDKETREGELVLEEKVVISEEDIVAKFIHEMVEAGQEELVARAALANGIEPNDIDGGLLWCIENERSIFSEREEKKKSATAKVPLSIASEQILSTLSSSGESAIGPLIRDLRQLWTAFQTSISSNLTDYLSVEQLGIVLKYISRKGTTIIDREFLQCFQSGVPNLLVCCQDDVINTILSIYCQDTKQPLPCPDEVLLCTQETSLNEIEIFWRRAMYNDCGKIHCLANVENLSYDVSEKGERRLDYHMQNALTREIQYKLVVICGTEQENNSRIVAALDKHRRPPLPLMSHQVLLPCIREKLTADMNKMPMVPAASVDFECCTVRIIKSWRSGVGKTLYKKRLVEKLNLTHKKLDRGGRATTITIPIHEKRIEVDEIMSVLLQNTSPTMKTEPRIFHIDLSHEVEEGVDYLLFQLLILGCLTNSQGYIWRKSPFDLYLVESLPILSQNKKKNQLCKCLHQCLDILPDVVCRSPSESFGIYKGSKIPEGFRDSDALFDQQEFESIVFQRPFQYLYRLDRGQSLKDINLHVKEIFGTPQLCLQTLLGHCGVVDPSWSELRNFVWFLSTQLLDFESSDYVSDAAAEFLPGFAQFVLKFLIQMSRDFATRSLNLSEETPSYATMTENDDTEDIYNADIRKFQMRRTWENSPHPYLFFNPDHNTMTFVGFTIDRWTGNLVDYQTKKIIEKAILSKDLGIALHQNNVNMNENFDRLTRKDKLQKLGSVMGLKRVHDPDSTYELTMDNVKKILAIYMRFRCDIPVIIMGETGCGKTRLIQFMCQLQCPDVKNVKNMLVMKVHGGTKKIDIINKVKEAEKEAKRNSEKEETKNIFTVLFFDEANTTEAIGVIKEIMCDKTICGEPLNLCQSLKIVAACNPYKKHSKKMIQRLEQAGLGYHVDAYNTTDRMGRIPMRRLVYRVQPLPQSLLPLVWDFGQLDTKVEELYTKQMILRYKKDGKIPDVDGIEDVLSRILTVAQEFMRKQKDECSFVSLRDVERVLTVFNWFCNEDENGSLLLNMLNKPTETDESSDEDEEDDGDTDENIEKVTNLTTALVLALGVCYHASLKNRDEFRSTITKTFVDPFYLPRGSEQMLDLIDRCQEVFLNNVKLDENIARNKALKENVFMMLVCIELRIPLFLVGKPGSSKSLAKTIVADAMQGNSSFSPLFKNYKQVKMVSFQCSPLSIAEGIIATFRQCAKYQKDGDLKKFVSVVVLDEVGLAEDSPKMPLKTLHPLLENGCLEDEEPEPYKKVAFIGISNWALDPAKMNRGILVQRETPDLDELIETAKGICSEEKQHWISSLIKPLANAYLAIFEAVLKKREFFGLRDFYSLIKMIYAFTVTNKRRPTWLMLKHSIKRNFGGTEEIDIDPLKIFIKHLEPYVTRNEAPTAGDPDCSATGLIKACLREKQSRYLLLLTENYGALSVLQQKVLKMNTITIFGSSFQSDQQYTQVCRNINRIKVCMETGATVILLNLENLYESLYDALNQYYVYLGGERYVDLGLGSHRVKCRVHKNFRLIVVAEKDVVYKKFPIPLINRLEKHFLNISTMLSPFQMKLTSHLEQWIDDFVTPLTTIQAHHFKRNTAPSLTKMDVFIGYHADTCASIVLQICHELCEEKKDNDAESESDSEEDREEFDEKIMEFRERILESSKELLLWCVTPDAILRLGTTKLKEFEKEIRDKYFFYQKHESLSSYFLNHLREEKTTMCLQVTTHSKLLTTGDLDEISKSVDIEVSHITLLSLQSFDTEQQFCRQLRHNFEKNLQDKLFLIVQCDNGIENANLIACARYCVLDELQQLSNARKERTHIVFIIHLPRMSSGHFAGFQCGVWKTVHIDDIKSPDNDIPRITEMVGKSIGTLLESATKAKPVIYSVKESSTPEQEEASEIEFRERENEEDLNDHTKQAAFHRNFNFPALVKMSVHSSLAMVKDPDDPERATHRVKLLIKLLHDTGERDASFMMGICLHLSKLMKEKENEVTGDSANIWLTSEATSRDHINRVGTFRKAMTQCVVDKLSPLLAGIISKVDTNRNLDILEETQSAWKQRLWLGILNAPNATGIKYSMFISPQGLKQMSDYNVLGTGFDGHMFSAKMPFSWIVFNLVQNTVQTESSMTSDGTDSSNPVFTISKIVENLPLGKILETYLQQVQVDDFLTAYIHDFIHMVYPPCSDTELQLVCGDLRIGCHLLLNEQEPTSAVCWIVAIHMAYEKSSVLFQNFNSIAQVWPNCSFAVKEYMQSDENKGMVTSEEQILDVLGLCLLVRNLEPKVETFTDAKGRQKWVLMVNKYRPVVERILDQDTYGSSKNSKRESGIREARYQWTRATVLKLFLEHVCSTNDFHAKRCMILWKMLKGEADMKTFQSLEKIEKFLTICMKEAMKKAFGDQKICKSCESEIVERPIQLPCGDVICVRCFKEAPITGKTVCPVCHAGFPADFQPLDTEICKPEIKEFNSFKKSCNSFYMDVVSQLCFSDDMAPSQEVIEKLMSHIAISPKTGKAHEVMSKEISIFDEGIDPSPVLRSFLLQHLLRTSFKDVETYLEKYLLNAQNLFKNKESSLFELSVMIINCFEDSFTQECSKTSDNKNSELKMAVQMLTKNVHRLQTEPFGIAKVLLLSECRFGLKIAADCLYKIEVTKSVKKSSKHVRRILDVTEKFCAESGLIYPRHFIIKYLCRCYGVESFQAICSSHAHDVVKQIDLPELHMDEVIQCLDRFIVCGRIYQEVREAITKSIFGKNNSPLKKVLEEIQEPEPQQRIVLLLALFKEVTMSNLFDRQDKRRISFEQTKNFVEGYLSGHPLFKDRKEVLVNVCRNVIVGEFQLEWIARGMNLRHQNMICVLFHFFVTLLEMPLKNTLFEPLAQLIIDPKSMKDALLPTMPQDDTEDFRNIIYAANLIEGRPVQYRCPNGHAYFIGDCGQPTTFSKCPDCGQKVGGENYKLQARNKLDQGEDTTEKGHILGDADLRQQVATPERDLSPLQCAVLRLFTHMSMYLGGCRHPKEIQALIKPNVSEDKVLEYIWKHMEIDILILQQAIGKSAEDVYLLLHCICRDFVTEKKAQVKERDVCRLQNKAARKRWEQMFAKLFLENIFMDMDNVMESFNEEIGKDARIGSDPLTCLLIEEDISEEKIDLNDLHNIPVVWRYRSQITISHLSRTFLAQAPQNAFPILRIFLDEEHHLKAIRLIPSIIKLQKILIQFFQDRLDKTDAAHMAIDKTLEKELKDHNLGGLVSDFLEAWRCVREHLGTFTFLTPKGNRQLPIECSQKIITEKDWITYLLPTFQDNGLCSYALLYFLLKKQNTFLMEYCRRKNYQYKDLPKVHLKDLTTAHLICFHPTKDILPMVMANSQYTFEVEKGTRVHYNFADLERQLMDRILFSKSVIEMPLSEFPIMTYASERTNASVFRDLRRNVKQEPLAPVVVHQICTEFKSYPDICDALKKLDIAISFLKSVGGDIEMNLESFMSQTLQIENPFPTQKVKMSCQCKHAQALWIALTLTKTKNQSCFQEDTFEGISGDFRKEMDEKERKALQNMCKDKEISLEKINCLVDMMFECISLQITIPADEEFDMASLSLRDTLMEYSQAPCYDIPQKVQDTPDVTDLIQKIPASILNTKAIDVWLCVYTIYTEKDRPRR